MENTLKVGNKVKFKEDKRPYTVKASRGKFAICTYPAFGTAVYCIIDFDREIRSPNDYTFNPFDYTKQEDIDRCMDDLFLPETDGTRCELSQRRKCDLNIENIY